MTVNVLYTVWCDGKTEHGDCGEWITADTAWEARDLARSHGWTCGKTMKSRDLCPKHREAP